MHLAQQDPNFNDNADLQLRQARDSLYVVFYYLPMLTCLMMMMFYSLFWSQMTYLNRCKIN
jgi:hypothetical protein